VKVFSGDIFLTTSFCVVLNALLSRKLFFMGLGGIRYGRLLTLFLLAGVELCLVSTVHAEDVKNGTDRALLTVPLPAPLLAPSPDMPAGTVKSSFLKVLQLSPDIQEKIDLKGAELDPSMREAIDRCVTTLITNDNDSIAYRVAKAEHPFAANAIMAQFVGERMSKVANASITQQEIAVSTAQNAAAKAAQKGEHYDAVAAKKLAKDAKTAQDLLNTLHKTKAAQFAAIEEVFMALAEAGNDQATDQALVKIVIAAMQNPGRAAQLTNEVNETKRHLAANLMHNLGSLTLAEALEIAEINQAAKLYISYAWQEFITALSPAIAIANAERSPLKSLPGIEIMPVPVAEAQNDGSKPFELNITAWERHALVKVCWWETHTILRGNAIDPDGIKSCFASVLNRAVLKVGYANSVLEILTPSQFEVLTTYGPLDKMWEVPKYAYDMFDDVVNRHLTYGGITSFQNPWVTAHIKGHKSFDLALYKQLGTVGDPATYAFHNLYKMRTDAKLPFYNVHVLAPEPSKGKSGPKKNKAFKTGASNFEHTAAFEERPAYPAYKVTPDFGKIDLG
jgi:hypothetical protein